MANEKSRAAEQAETEGVTLAPTEGSPEWYAEKVPIKLFKDSGKYQDDVFVAVNGVGYLIQRGVEVEVPRYVAEVLAQSMEQDQQAADFMALKAGEFAAESRARGL